MWTGICSVDLNWLLDCSLLAAFRAKCFNSNHSIIVVNILGVLRCSSLMDDYFEFSIKYALDVKYHWISLLTTKLKHSFRKFLVSICLILYLAISYDFKFLYFSCFYSMTYSPCNYWREIDRKAKLFPLISAYVPHSIQVLLGGGGVRNSPPIKNAALIQDL